MEPRHWSGHFLFLAGQIPDCKKLLRVVPGLHWLKYLLQCPRLPSGGLIQRRWTAEGIPSGQKKEVMTQGFPNHHRVAPACTGPHPVPSLGLCQGFKSRAGCRRGCFECRVSTKLTIRKGDPQVAWPSRPLEYWCQEDQKSWGTQEHLYVRNSLMRRRRQVYPQREHAAHTLLLRATMASTGTSLTSKFAEVFAGAGFSFKLWFQHGGSLCLLRHLSQVWAPQTRWTQPEKIFKCSLHLSAPLWSWIKCENIDCELGTNQIHKTKWNKMNCVTETL